MNKQTFEELLRVATQVFKGKKKQPTTPAKQFEKGAVWLWDLLMAEYTLYLTPHTTSLSRAIMTLTLQQLTIALILLSTQIASVRKT